ncbi:phosphoribosylaminoimidazolesuccinocarboxamide synthase [Candidatus Falkowbacteria bacterium]|nr:phosphoribosylaminoimidazolesuccinocarboxamide synthase [Candidatus Falkowbacteria bacterium]
MNRLPLLQTDFPDLKLAGRGKVRDIYDLGETLLIVTTDRISAFDVIMGEPVPSKGYVLNQLSAFWFDQMEEIIPNHMISICTDDFPEECHKYAHLLAGRSMLVKKAQPLAAECIVRGYISGSGWKDYKATGSICGIKLPTGLVESDRLDEPIFTPSTKAELGTHDENISFDRMVDLVGYDIACDVRRASLNIYSRARDIANTRGIIIADTKFEFGIYDGQLIIIDECMTPDSSRFWPKDQYKPGGPQPSFDKQFLRDYLETLDWGKTAPAPPLPPEIVAKTAEKYMEALTRIARPRK